MIGEEMQTAVKAVLRLPKSVIAQVRTALGGLQLKPV
jgi:hypothetical protein